MRNPCRIFAKRCRRVGSALLFLLSVVCHSSHAQGFDTTVLPPPVPQGGGSFGFAVSVSADGRTALVGAPNQEAAYVFVQNSGSWVLQATLSATSPAATSFGGVVALSADGTVALVADTGENCSGQPTPPSVPAPCGVVYIYTRSGNVWTFQTSLAAPPHIDFEFYFGTALALSADGSTVFVARPFNDCIFQPCRGAVFVYERSGSSWNLVDTLTGSNPAVQEFGLDVSLSPDGNLALIGAPFTPCAAGLHCGEAYVFARNGGSWSEQATLTAFDAGPGAYFGSSVGLSADGQTALIGAPRIGLPFETLPGSVYPFADHGGSWSGTQKITAGGPGEMFGERLDLAADGRSALIGVPAMGCTAGSGCGAVYQIVRGTGGVWSSPHPLASFPAGASGGSSVALSGDGFVGLAGAPRISCTAGPDCGAVYIFSGLAAVGVPTLGGAGLALLTLALIVSALVLLRRRRVL